MGKIRNTTKEVHDNPVFGLLESMNIEGAEKRGQRELVESCQLPYKACGGTYSKPSYEEVVTEYAKHGIKVLQISEEDDIFVDVELPKGWKKQYCESQYWSDLLDHNGRKRASMFYKGAFYDRSSHLYFVARFKCQIVDYLPMEEKGHYEIKKVKVEVDSLKGSPFDKISYFGEMLDNNPFNEIRRRLPKQYEEREEKIWISKYKDSYDEYRHTPIYVEVLDGDTVIFSTKDDPKFFTDKYNKEKHWEWWEGYDKLKESVKQRGLDFLKENYPNWEDTTAYFND